MFINYYYYLINNYYYWQHLINLSGLTWAIMTSQGGQLNLSHIYTDRHRWWYCMSAT